MNLTGKRGIATTALSLFTILLTVSASAQRADTVVPSIKGLTKAEAESVYYEAINARTKGDDKEAEQLLQETIHLDPNAAAAYYDLSRLSIKQNNLPKATEYVKKAVALQGGNKWYKSQYAEILAMSNKFDEAAVVYNHLAKDEKYNEEYLLKAAFLYQKTGKYKEALALLDQMLAKSYDEELVLQQQQIYLKMNDLQGAVKVTQGLIDQNPAEARYIVLMADLYENNKQPDKALEIYKQAEKKFPDDPSVLLGLADHYKKNKQEDKYFEYMSKAMGNKSLDAESQLTLLVSHLQEAGNDTMQRRTALELAEKIVVQHPDNAQVLAVYGDLLSMNNQSDNAVVQYKRSLAIDQSKYGVWQNLLYNYTDRKNADSLIVYSEKAQRLFPNQAMIHYLNGVGHINKQEYDKGIKAINRAIDMQPDDNQQALADMYSALGDAYNSANKYTESDSAYEKALKLAPDNASVLNNYSYYLSVRNKRLPDAERMSKRSLELRPDEGTFLDTYGWILYKQGEYKKAKEYIEKAVNANPQATDGTLLDHLGDIYYKLNNTDKAVEYWKQAKERGTDNAQIDKKIQDRKLYD
ncbi:MAG: tetratricopeptide repeat protein [Sphingobacteriales bacterium]|nr:MAG: tetratricopeptide repeat protein [Sphingobacteriales bacterium]